MSGRRIRTSHRQNVVHHSISCAQAFDLRTIWTICCPIFDSVFPTTKQSCDNETFTLQQLVHNKFHSINSKLQSNIRIYKTKFSDFVFIFQRNALLVSTIKLTVFSLISTAGLSAVELSNTNIKSVELTR